MKGIGFWIRLLGLRLHCWLQSDTTERGWELIERSPISRKQNPVLENCFQGSCRTGDWANLSTSRQEKKKWRRYHRNGWKKRHPMKLAAVYSFNNGTKVVSKKYPDIIVEINAAIK